MMSIDWPYPGSRWRKFDFHTHTPASVDVKQALDAKRASVSAEDWLLRFMAAEIDCVAITDHNSGAWIDPLKAAYATMKEQAGAGQAPAGFRELTLFPAVEISVSGGFHLLALFDPDATTRTITDLLASVGYRGTDGDSDGVTSDGPETVIAKVLRAGGVPIPAHADKEKGLLQCQSGTRKPGKDAHTIQQALGVNGLLAVEWCNAGAQAPECVTAQVSRLAHVLGSDFHPVKSEAGLGNRYTWVKTADPTLEGLRLALLDGNDISLLRVEDHAQDTFDPFRIPADIVTAIEVDSARVMGNGQPTRLPCSPFFNAIVGGRGTGKSTIVHALRLATRRDGELVALGEGSEPATQFKAFRNDALRPESAMRVEWSHDGERLRLTWRNDGQGPVVEEWCDSGWQASASQSVNAARFPIRIFSQGQIAALAGNGRKALLPIIDEAANTEPLKQSLEDARRTFLTQRSRLRELDGKLAAMPEVERRLRAVAAKLEALSKAGHAEVLRDYAKTQRQSRALASLFEQLRADAAHLAALPEKIVLDDWPAQYFGEEDTDVLAWRTELERKVAGVRERISDQAKQFAALIETEARDARLRALHKRVQTADEAHAALQAQLAQQGVDDPQAFARLTQERQQLEAQHKALDQIQRDRDAMKQQIASQQALLLDRRQGLTHARQTFVQQTLANNPHVRIEVVPMGFDARQLERELRELLDADEHFAGDILVIENDEPSHGIAVDLAQADEADKVSTLAAVKGQLLEPDEHVGGHFRNYLKRRNEKPEFGDRVLAWFPEDDLRIEYKREQRWESIRDGSQGQRSAALLAFLLAFGDEPIVLDQPEDDLDNHLIYELIVRQIRENKLRRQLIVVTHNANVVVNGDAELVHVMAFARGQCRVEQSGALQEKPVRDEVCRVMEGGREAFSKRWKRLGPEV